MKENTEYSGSGGDAYLIGASPDGKSMCIDGDNIKVWMIENGKGEHFMNISDFSINSCHLLVNKRDLECLKVLINDRIDKMNTP